MPFSSPPLEITLVSDHPQGGIAAAHIADQFQFFLGVLVWMMVRAAGLAGKRLDAPVPAGFPEIDVGAAFVVFAAGSADAVFLSILHEGLPITHILCYTVRHEGSGLLSLSCLW